MIAKCAFHDDLFGFGSNDNDVDNDGIRDDSSNETTSTNDPIRARTFSDNPFGFTMDDSDRDDSSSETTSANDPMRARTFSDDFFGFAIDDTDRNDSDSNDSDDIEVLSIFNVDDVDDVDNDSNNDGDNVDNDDSDNDDDFILIFNLWISSFRSLRLLYFDEFRLFFLLRGSLVL